MYQANIAFVITKSEVGGAQTWVKDQIKITLDSGEFNNVHIITASVGWLTKSIPEHVKVHIVPEIESNKSFSAILKLLKIFRTYNIKLAISSSANAGLYSRLAGLFSKKTKQIYVSHGWSAIYNGGNLQSFYVSIEKVLGNYFSDKILCVSHCDAKKAQIEIGLRKSKLTTIRNTVSCNSFVQEEEKKLDKNILKLAFIGRIIKPKRQDLAIKAVSTLSDICTLDIIGGGNQLFLPENVENVKLIGEIESFSNYYDYDALILISESEGLPMVALEAGINALPIIISNVGGCPEVINNNGIIVDNDYQSIRQAVIDLHRNYEIYSYAAFKLRKEFDLDNSKQAYIKTYLSNLVR